MTRIGKYEIKSEIEGGKEFRVRAFQALDGDISRAVTLKLLAKPGDRLADRFRREVSCVARLRVPTVIAIYELGEHEGCPFVVMPDLGNDHVGRAIEEQRSLTLLQKTLILERIAAGAGEMQRGGLAYLGIRPSAVALANDGATIQDFGVVRLFAADTESAYLSPEESNAGYPPDSLCDVFAFGVLCYQFLAGAHPFGDSRSREALSRDPRLQIPPLRGALPDCPENLEKLVSRLLEGRREFRYQTFDDVLDELRPIVQGLKRAGAANLWADGRRLMREGKLEEAQSVVRQSLQLHPDDPDAGQISAELSDLMRNRRLKTRIEDLWLQAEQAAANRRFFQAVEILTSASRLDESGMETTSRLDAARTRLNNSLAAGEFTVEAQNLLAQHQVEEARAKVALALARDPEEPEAIRLRDEIDRVLGLQNRLQSLTSEAGSLLSQQRFAEAVRLLESAPHELSKDPGLSDLLGRARAALEQAKTIEHALARCNELREANRFDQALDEVNRALAKLPGEAALLALRHDVHAQAESYRLAAAVRQVLDEVNWLLAEDRPDLAVRFLKQRGAGIANEPALAGRLAELEQTLAAWERRRLLESLQDFSVHADGDKDRPDRAIALLPVLDTLLSAGVPPEVADAATRFRKRLRAHATLAEVRLYLAAGNVDHAEQTLRKGLDSFEGFPAAALAQKQVEACREYLRERRRAQVSLARNQLTEAEQILVRLAAPDRPEVQTLLEVVRTRRAATDDATFRESVRERARNLLRQGSQDDADNLIRNLGILFPAEPASVQDRPVVSAGRPRPLKAPASLSISEPAAVPARATVGLLPEHLEVFRSRMKGILAPVSSRVPAVALVAGLITLSAASAAIWRFTRVAASTAAARPVSVSSVVPGSPNSPALSEAHTSPAATPVPDKAAPAGRVAATSSSVKRVAKPAPEAERPVPRAFLKTNLPASPAPTGPVTLPAPPSAAVSSPALDASAVPVIIGQVALSVPPPSVPPPSVPKPPSAAPAPPPHRGEVQLPKLISGKTPAFPPLAHQNHISGTVNIEVLIDLQGRVKSITAVHGNPLLTKAAIEALAAWRFQPASVDGNPVEARTTVTMHFDDRQR